MDTTDQQRKRGRPAGSGRYTERLPSVMVTPTDGARLREILLKRRMTASELLRELIRQEHRRLKKVDGDGVEWAP